MLAKRSGEQSTRLSSGPTQVPKRRRWLKSAPGRSIASGDDSIWIWSARRGLRQFPAMDLSQPPRLPAQLETAVQRVRMAARSAAEHTVDSLGLAAMAAVGVLQRDALLGAQYELNRKLAIFALTFNETLDADVARQAGTQTPPPSPLVTPDSLVASWESLTLVENHEVELHISADRFALEISHACEWEIRELDGYMATLLHLGAADPGRNPLRAEVLGQAMIRAIASLADRPEVRKVLSSEIGRSLAHAMRQTYCDIVADLRRAGVRPLGLALRGKLPLRGPSAHGASSAHGTLDTPATDSDCGRLPADRADIANGGAPAAWQRRNPPAATASPSHQAEPTVGRGGIVHSQRGPLAHSLGRIDGEMMSLIRRLAQQTAAADADGRYPGSLHDEGGGAYHRGDAQGLWLDEGDGAPRRLAAPNLIVAHREELRQAATGTLDHMVIDVIGSLFDQILSDPRVPPQLARQIARLQLPVLRAALGDNSFFSSRRHPVRRFINRIASLGSAVDDIDGPAGQALQAQVAELVQQLVEGEFDRIEVYEQKLQSLEEFVASQARAELGATGAADQVLARKEAQLQVQQRFGQALERALKGLPVPDYLRNFLSGVWSQAIASAAAEEGVDGALTSRFRNAARDLVMSVQPKATPAHRQLFLRQLPPLMKTLQLGLDRIACPHRTRQDFFDQLLPAHAESLQGQALSTLDHNLLLRQVDKALATPLPEIDDGNLAVPASDDAVAALQALVTPATFTPEEAKAVGLLVDTSVDWNGALDIDLSIEPELCAADLAFTGLPVPEAPEPSSGKSLADHVQIGFAYQMQLQGHWQKVRLGHVSAARSFYVFSHGAKQRETVSMTHRMLVKLCDAGRLRAMEGAYLLERASARARRQLASISLRKH